MRHTIKLSLIATVIAAASVQAEEGFRQHEAHVHGHVEFNIAQDGNELLAEIHAPGADVVGFEHAPENDEQRELIKGALHTLTQADQILLLTPAAGCKVEYVNVSNTLEPHKDDDHDAHEEHEHEEHDHDTHEGHDHDEHSGHGEFTIEYHFDCDDIAKLEQIDTSWFKHFANTKEVGVNLLTDNSQQMLELDKDNHIIKF